jgi:hypothetical protein
MLNLKHLLQFKVQIRVLFVEIENATLPHSHCGNCFEITFSEIGSVNNGNVTTHSLLGSLLNISALLALIVSDVNY